MDLQQLLDSVTAEAYEGLKRAVEIGKWPDGRVLSEEHRAFCMQAIIACDQRKPEDQRIGYMPPKTSPCQSSADPDPQPLKWE